MGQRTGVTQMVLSRSAFGRRGAYLPTVFQMIIATGWIAINTWIILDLTAELLSRLGIPGTPATKIVLVLLIMAIQVGRSEEHTSELQSRQYLVCRLLLEKKKYCHYH